MGCCCLALPLRPTLPVVRRRLARRLRGGEGYGSAPLRSTIIALAAAGPSLSNPPRFAQLLQILDAALPWPVLEESVPP